MRCLKSGKRWYDFALGIGTRFSLSNGLNWQLHGMEQAKFFFPFWLNFHLSPRLSSAIRGILLINIFTSGKLHGYLLKCNAWTNKPSHSVCIYIFLDYIDFVIWLHGHSELKSMKSNSVQIRPLKILQRVDKISIGNPHPLLTMLSKWCHGYKATRLRVCNLWQAVTAGKIVRPSCFCRSPEIPTPKYD